MSRRRLILPSQEPRWTSASTHTSSFNNGAFFHQHLHPWRTLLLIRATQRFSSLPRSCRKPGLELSRVSQHSFVPFPHFAYTLFVLLTPNRARCVASTTTHAFRQSDDLPPRLRCASCGGIVGFVSLIQSLQSNRYRVPTVCQPLCIASRLDLTPLDIVLAHVNLWNSTCALSESHSSASPQLSQRDYIAANVTILS